MRVAGVDGRQGGWVVAVVAVDGAPELVDLAYTRDLAAMVEASDAAAIAIDMPIGLPDAEGRRECDLAARRLLRPYGSRVFPAPVRATLDHIDDYPAACEASIATCGKSLSKQTWNLLRAIREVDACADDARLVECHPEVAFALLARAPIDAVKKSAEGRRLRLAALRTWLPDLADPPYGDDGLDALACAWTAARIATGTAVTLPAGEVPRDAAGRPMRIVA